MNRHINFERSYRNPSRGVRHNEIRDGRMRMSQLDPTLDIPRRRVRECFRHFLAFLQGQSQVK